MSRHLRIRPGAVEWRDFEEEVVAVDTRKAVYMAVNRSGSVLWPALLDGTTREELVDRLIQTYGVDRSAAEQDVDAFVSALDEQELLEP
jgi:hypothetical protein